MFHVVLIFNRKFDFHVIMLRSKRITKIEEEKEKERAKRQQAEEQERKERRKKESAKVSSL